MATVETTHRDTRAWIDTCILFSNLTRWGAQDTPHGFSGSETFSPQRSTTVRPTTLFNKKCSAQARRDPAKRRMIQRASIATPTPLIHTLFSFRTLPAEGAGRDGVPQTKIKKRRSASSGRDSSKDLIHFGTSLRDGKPYHDRTATTWKQSHNRGGTRG